MGRTKVKIEKIPSEAQRKATYWKRSKGLIKKAREISILTDVDVSLVMFSCTGKLDHFSSQPRIWKTLQRFIQNVPDNERIQISQDTINTINMLAEQHDSANQSREEIKREIIDDDIHQKLLQLKNRVMHPSRKAFKSQEQFAGLIQSLENIRQTVVNRRMQMQMQQMPGGSEAGMRDPLQVRQQIQQQGVQSFGVGDPLTSSNSAQLIKLNVAGSSNVDTSDPLPRGHQEGMQENRTMGDPCSSSYADLIFSTDQQIIMDPRSLPDQKVSELFDIPEDILALLSEEYQEQNMLLGMDLSGSVQITGSQPSASIWWNKIDNATELDSTAQTNPEAFNTGQEFQIPMQQSQGAPEAGMWIPQQGGEHMLQRGAPEFGMGNLSSSSVLSKMPGKVKPESVARPYKASDVGAY